MSAGWGPFLRSIDEGERKTRLRCLRLATKLVAGRRAHDAVVALVRAEISGGDPDLLDEAEAAFGQLAPLDRRRILSGYQTVA